jgi:ABC-type transport system involved in multi-copper enzyme maturation permease subunit
MNALLKTIIFNDIRLNLLSLRLQVLFVIMLVVFIMGSVAYIFQYKSAADEYQQYVRQVRNDQTRQVTAFLTGPSERNITSVAVEMRNYLFQPVQNSFIEDAGSKYIPNTITYNAYNVFNYSVSRISGNPYMYLSQDLNWSFIVTIILSFAILLLSFDSISGERESHTLSLVLSNSVPRSVLFTGKFISITVTGFLMTVPGYIISLLILIVSGTVSASSAFLFESVMFITASILFISCIAALGLFCSALTHSSNISLLVSLTLWSLFLIFSPNLAVFSAENLFSIKDSETIQREIESSKDAVNKAAPEGSWSMNGGDQFYPKHELRANNQTNLMNAEKKIRDNWFSDQFMQYEKATLMTSFSPFSIFGRINESITGCGYIRFSKNWEDLHAFQLQFLEWFKEIDANDKNSPHWYNPYEDCSTSRIRVKFEEIPLYSETIMSIPQRLKGALPGILLLIIYSAVLMGLTVTLFNRYDVR